MYCNKKLQVKFCKPLLCCFQVDPTFLQEFLQSFDVTQLSRDERNLLIVYHSGPAMRFLNDYQLAELRVRQIYVSFQNVFFFIYAVIYNLDTIRQQDCLHSDCRLVSWWSSARRSTWRALRMTSQWARYCRDWGTASTLKHRLMSIRGSAILLRPVGLLALNSRESSTWLQYDLPNSSCVVWCISL